MKGLLFTSVAVAIVSASVRAADIYVSSSGTYGPDGAAKYTDLADAVAAAAAGETVWIEDGYVYDSDASLAVLGSTKCRILVSKAITLRSASGDATNGGGATIRGAWHDSTTAIGANAVRALGINTTGVAIRGLVLENGATTSANGGGGLALSGAARAFVTNCVVRNCSAGMGGGVYISNNDFLTLSGCVVTNNTSSDFGGGVSTYAMRVGSGAYIVDTIISGNTCGNRGGGVSGGNGLALDSCIVSNNVAVRGGAVFGSNYVATNCTFTANTATYIGGGLSVLDSAVGDTVSCVGCWVTDNLATNASKNAAGGGIYDNKGVVRLESCVIAGNTSNNGGGIYGGTNIVSTVVSNNCATTGNGGGIYFLGVARVGGSTIVSNAASSANGGGICTTANKPVVISGSRIVGNCAGGTGGGAQAPSATFTNTVVAANRAVSHGGGVYGSQTVAQMPVLRGCIVTNNAASANGDRGCNGGGLWYAVAYDSNISGNSTTGSGAGAFNCVLTTCMLADNDARDLGGSVSCLGGGAINGFATNCVFAGNSALRTGTRNDSGGGGGAYNVSGVGNVFRGNRARLGGGAFLKAGNTLVNCAISNNVANTNGGGVYGTGSVYNSLVVDNSLSDASGGAAAAGASGEASSAPYKLVLVNCTVAGNDGDVSRGGLYQVAITNTISWANLGDDDSRVSPAVSSCAAILTDGEDGNINSDPKLAADWTLGKRSPCIDAATRFDWMTAANDVRSLDVFAKPRVNGEPDMGAAEFYPVVRGLMLLLR